MAGVDVRLGKVQRMRGSARVPGDKSLSHRALLFGSLAEGTTEIKGLSDGDDVVSTRRCLGAMGVGIRTGADRTMVDGKGLRGWKPSGSPLHCGNSGSTMRMLMGPLAGQTFCSTLLGDASLSQRPMQRVAAPLQAMGAQIELTDGAHAPVTMTGVRALSAIDHRLEVASAQVKTAILLAALFAEGTTRICGKIHSRDHTERLLPHFGVMLSLDPLSMSLRGGQSLRAARVEIPGDPSSAAFWLAAACIVPGACVRLSHVLLNPTRIGFVRVLQRMGAHIEQRLTATEPEPAGELVATGGRLVGVIVDADEVSSLIDELPMLAVLATYAHGTTCVRGAAELRVKETDRIEAVADNLRRMGAQLETFGDGFRIEGPQRLTGASLDCYHDHRIAMAFAVGALGAEGETRISHAESVTISDPGFFKTLQELTS